MKKCPFCKADIEDNARFCLYCMKPLNEKEVVLPPQKKRRWWPFVIAGSVLLALLMLILLMQRGAAPQGETTESTQGEEATPTESNGTEDTPQPSGTTGTNQTPEQNSVTPEPIQPQSHTHDWKSEYQDATCNKEGYIRTKCSCGEIMSETKLPKTSHSWKSASCAAPKTCTNCGATEGSALSHSWMDATYDRPKTCRNCQATEGSALAAPTINVRDTFPKSYYYYSRSFTVSSCQASFGADSLGARYIRLSMDVSRVADSTPTAGKLALKVNIYDSQNKLVQQDSIWSDDLSVGVSSTMTASIPIPKTSQSDSYTISFEESY